MIVLRRFCGFLCLIISLHVHAQDKQWVIAFAQDDMRNDFRRAQVFSARDAAAKYSNIDFIYSDAEGRTSLLVYQLETFISQGVDAIILGTNHTDLPVPTVEKAHQAGIKVIILDRGLNAQQYTSFINSDNRQIGRLAGEYLVDQIAGKGTLLLLEGLPAADVTLLRSEGFLDVVSAYPDIKVIKRTANYLRKDAINAIDQLVAEGVEFDGVFSESDSMLSGMRMSLQRHGIDPASIFSVGCDFTSEAKQAILDGQQTASVYFPLGGQESIDAAMDALAGKRVEKHITIPVKLITRELASEVDAIF